MKEIRKREEGEVTAFIYALLEATLNSCDGSAGRDPVYAHGPEKIIAQQRFGLHNAERLSRVCSYRAESTTRAHDRVGAAAAGKQIERWHSIGCVPARMCVHQADAQQINLVGAEDVPLLRIRVLVAGDFKIRPQRNRRAGKRIDLICPVNGVAPKQRVS